MLELYNFKFQLRKNIFKKIKSPVTFFIASFIQFELEI